MPEIVRFGMFEFNPKQRELRRKGVRIRLQQQQFEILRLLVEYRGELVTRELIQQTLWPDGRFVDFERSINTAVMRLRYAMRDDAGSPTYIETVARSGYRLIPPVADKPQTPAREAIRAIAILPLQDLSGTGDSESFVDGLTDAFVTALAAGSDLRVVSRTSAARYKGSPLSMRAIATELNVQALVEGSVLHVGDRIRISVRLLDTVRDTHLWAQTYDRDLKDILPLQQEIAQAIVASTTAVIKRSEATETPRRIDASAYDLYLRGNFMVSSHATDQLDQAAECYENATLLEPQWAAPYAMLAECRRSQAFFDYASAEPLIERARNLTEKALQLDPNNAQANATAGIVLAVHDWNWNAGLERIRMALRSSPRSALIEHIGMQIMLHMGRFDEALRHAGSAISIDPSSMLLWGCRALALYVARRHADCLHESEQLLEQNANFPLALLGRAVALTELGRVHEALAGFDRLTADKGWSMVLVGRIQAHRRAGNSGDVQAGLAELERRAGEGTCSPAILAWAYLAAGEIDPAYTYLEKALEARDTRLSLLVRLSPFDAIRYDERFLQCLRQMHLDS